MICFKDEYVGIPLWQIDGLQQTLPQHWPIFFFPNPESWMPVFSSVPNCSRLSSSDNSWSSTASFSWIIFVLKVLVKKIGLHWNSITYIITNALSYTLMHCMYHLIFWGSLHGLPRMAFVGEFSFSFYIYYKIYFIGSCSWDTIFFPFYLCDTCIIKSLCFILLGESKRTEWVKPVLGTVQTKSGHHEFAGTYYPAFLVHCKHHSIICEKMFLKSFSEFVYPWG